MSQATGIGLASENSALKGNMVAVETKGSQDILRSVSAIDNELNQREKMNNEEKLQQEVQKLIIVTIHMAANQRQNDQSSMLILSGANKPLPSSKRVADVVRTLVIPVAALEQREKEMRQIANALNIPTSRWNGSLLFTNFQKEMAAEESKQNGSDSKTRIVLRLHHDSVAKWSINGIREKIQCDESSAVSTTASSWFGLRTQSQLDFDWIQTYYVTGRIHIPPTARGYDILWLLDYFQFIYQPDQCHFGSFTVYERVQLWTKYYCYLRPILIDWVVSKILEEINENENRSTFPLMFGTTNASENCIELGTQRLRPLGDTLAPTSLMKGMGLYKRSMADMAMKIFNSIAYADRSVAQTCSRNQNQDGTASCTDETQTTLPCPEECTASEMRNDFCNFLMHHIRGSDLGTVIKKNTEWNIQFTVRPVTVHCTCDEPINRFNDHSNGNSNSSGSFPATSDSDGTNNFSNKNTYTRYRVVHRAVLVIDLRPVPTKQLCDLSLTCPLDELGEEELPKGHFLQVESRKAEFSVKPERRVTINENLSFEKDKPIAFSDHDKVAELSPSLAFADGVNCKLSLSDFNAPDDELNASMDSANIIVNASMGVFPPSFSSTKRKKKPKPVFELPEKLLSVDVEKLNQINGPPELTRMKHPIVKSSAAFDLSRDLTDGTRLPGPISIVRRGTYDNTVTSALTGPFYVDDNGILRDVFENGGADSDDDYDGDEDTRAQARRHEWIQTALMNRGIGERMENLLKESETNSNSNTSFDPWDWFTGLNLCEFSQEVIRSLEQYTNSVVHDSFVGVTSSPTNEAVKAASSAPATSVLSASSKNAIDLSDSPSNALTSDIVGDSESITNHIPLFKINGVAHDEQSREDEPFDSVDRKIIVQFDLDNREDGTRSHSSKESPREVQTFDCVTSASCERLLTQVSSDVTDDQVVDSNETNSQLSKKKARGIKGLFRRKKIDPTIDNSSK
jgi:hypothetical protein